MSSENDGNKCTKNSISNGRYLVDQRRSRREGIVGLSALLISVQNNKNRHQMTTTLIISGYQIQIYLPDNRLYVIMFKEFVIRKFLAYVNLDMRDIESTTLKLKTDFLIIRNLKKKQKTS